MSAARVAAQEEIVLDATLALAVQALALGQEAEGETATEKEAETEMETEDRRDIVQAAPSPISPAAQARVTASQEEELSRQVRIKERESRAETNLASVARSS
jgi:uncharacterized Zn finger protein